MVMADLYFSLTEPMRIQKKMVEAIIDASVNERALYTRSNWPAVTGNIMAFDGSSGVFSFCFFAELR
jgi:hypothetical protein